MCLCVRRGYAGKRAISQHAPVSAPNPREQWGKGDGLLTGAREELRETSPAPISAAARGR